MTLFLLASVWILVSWDCGRLHMSNTPISLMIRTATMTSMLTRTHCCHTCTSTLIVTRECNGMLLFNWNQCSHWLIENLAPWATWEGCVDQRGRYHDGNIRWVFRSSLLRNARLSICLEVWSMVWWLIGILELRLSSIDLKGDISLSLIRKIRANHLGSNLHLGAEAQFVDHTVQVSQQQLALQLQGPCPQLRSLHTLLQRINIGALPIDMLEELVTGGRGGVTQGVNWEFIESF